jgi:hypothetical protein
MVPLKVFAIVKMIIWELIRVMRPYGLGSSVAIEDDVVEVAIPTAFSNSICNRLHLRRVALAVADRNLIMP